jgi:hypothetical protein
VHHRGRFGLAQFCYWAKCSTFISRGGRSSPGLRRPRLPNDDGHVRILFLGKLVEQKGVFQLVEALGRISQLTDWPQVTATSKRRARL